MSNPRRRRFTASYTLTHRLQDLPRWQLRLLHAGTQRKPNPLRILPLLTSPYGAPPTTPVSIHHVIAVSPASIESLLGRTMEDLLNATMINSPLSLTGSQHVSPLTQGHLPDMALISRSSEMLATGLAQNAAQITTPPGSPDTNLEQKPKRQRESNLSKLVDGLSEDPY